MKLLKTLFAFAFVMLAGCSDFHSLWHDVKLPSGKSIKVTSFHLVWGSEHDERIPSQDCFAMEYVSTEPQADPARLEQEALEVFELIRPISEQWGFRTATIAGFPTVQRKGTYRLYLFERRPDGGWSSTMQEMKVFANDE